MPMSIYPPTLQSTQSAFLVDQPSYNIYFTLQRITNFEDVGHVQIRIVKQSNNRTIADISQYPDGTIYKDPSEIITYGNRYAIPILLNDLGYERWQAGFLYKVQMRFGTTSMYTDVKGFAAWKKAQIDAQTFSEWSTVMVIKAIENPIEATILNLDSVKPDIVKSEKIEPTLTPLFAGQYTSSINNKESIDKYRFDLYKGKVEILENEMGETILGELIETSGDLQHNNSQDLSTEAFEKSLDRHRFKTVLINQEHYTLIYSIQTTNGYRTRSEPYYFQVFKTYYETLKNVYLEVDDEDVFCRENGCLRLYFTSSNQLSGSFVISRSDEKSNYQVWEDLKYLTFNNKKFINTLIFEDYTIESGKKYKYAIQQENAAGLRTSPVYEQGNTPRHVDFEYSYFYHDDLQLRIMFNQKINSFKRNVLTSKQDTLGDKYPHLIKNGQAYYAEFPINGLISIQMDPDHTFFKIQSQQGLAYQGNISVPADKFNYQNYKRFACEDTPHIFNPDDNSLIMSNNDKNYLKANVQDNREPLDDGFYVNSDFTNNNIFIERIFREKVEEFLNNFDYKLYKSPTEGNIVVVLTNVSLTPSNTTGRMIYEFSATAYEVMENTLNNLDEFGIINIGRFEVPILHDIYSFGQIRGIHCSNKPINIIDLIKEQEEVRVGDKYKRHLERVCSFWIERYPKIDFINELAELYAQRSRLIKEGQSIKEIEEQISEYKSLSAALENMDRATVTINIDGRNILIPPNRIYSIRESINSLSVMDSLYPIIINYVCKLSQREDESKGVVSAIDASRIWGQISGVFTSTDEILKTYRYDYGPKEKPFRVFSKNSNDPNNQTILRDVNGNILLDNTNFNLYKTKNLLDIIKEETRKQVEVIYEIPNGFKQDDDGNWTDGTVYYDFADIVSFDIEADSGTVLMVGQKEDGSDAKQVIIGPTERYILNPMESLVSYIALKEPKFAIINYQCTTLQKVMKVGEDV